MTLALLIVVGWISLAGLVGSVLGGWISRVRNDRWKMYSTPMSSTLGTGWEVGVRRWVDDIAEYRPTHQWVHTPDRDGVRTAERQAKAVAVALNMEEVH